MSMNGPPSESARLPSDQLEELASLIAAKLGEPGRSALLDAEGVARLLGVPTSWVRAEARAGRIPHIKLGKYTRFDAAALKAWLDRRADGPLRPSTGSRPVTRRLKTA
jgi:excisionase family DNA binding protein